LGSHSDRKLYTEIKKVKKGLTVILMSAGPLLDFEECGVDEIIEKPFMISQVLRAAEELTNKSNIDILN